MLDHVDVAVGNRDEVEVAVGTRDPEEAARRLLDRGRGAGAGQEGRRGRARRDRPTAMATVAAAAGSRSSAGSARATPSAARCATACSPGWDPVRTARLRQRRRRDRRVAARLRRRDAHPGRARAALVVLAEEDRLSAVPDACGTSDRRDSTRCPTTAGASCCDVRATRPGRGRRGLRRAGAARSAVVGDRGTLFLVAADHPARGALGIRRRPAGDGRPAGLLRAAADRARRTRTSTACSARPTSSRSCCCSARSRARS